MTHFRKIALAAVALGAIAISIPSQAEAQRRHWGGGAVVGGLAAGVIVGSMIGAAAANPGPRYYYREPAYVAPQPVYVAPQPVYRSGYYDAPDCWWERRWVERRDGSMVRRNVKVCE